MQAAQLQLSCAGHSVVGRRKTNQDALLVQPALGLFVVADGMGGYEGGEIASATVVHALHDFVQRNDVDAEGTWPFAGRRGDPLQDLVEVGLQQARRHGRWSKMGSTAVVALLRGSRLVVGHLGDSRLYRLRGDRLVQLTRDHSMFEEMIRAGADPATLGHSLQHLLTRAVGMDTPPQCELRSDRVRPGDAYLLCSDGLWSPLASETICDRLNQPSPLRACDDLVEAAAAAGSTDNISAIVVRIHDAGRIP
jgi:serine/threonine protein phosphatase PrpC